MILLLNNVQAFTDVMNLIKRTVADDVDIPAVSIPLINDVVYDLFSFCVDRVNITDIDHEYQGLYQPFYDALNEMLLQQDIPLLAVSNLFVDGPESWTVVLILNNLRGVQL